MIQSEHDSKYLIGGVIGAIISIYGYFQPVPHLYYILGSFILLCVAVHYKLLYFIALEIILIAGHAAIILGIGPYTQVALPLLLCLQLLVFYLISGRGNSIFLIIGIFGIALLSIGFSYNDEIVFLSGSTGIAIYAYYTAFNGNPASCIWAILNTVFAIFSLYQLII